MRTRARKTTYQVSGLNSDAAAARVEVALLALPYVVRVVVDLVGETVTVTHRPDQAAADLVKEALIALGFASVAKG
ncbi:MAG TPA: cation transporter [Symbiobacteriaceae bacterium]|nr:cation transporter [Symbiobacteriaceae bacterium]